MRKRMFFLLTWASLTLAAVLIGVNPMFTKPTATSPTNPTIQMGQWPPPECGIYYPCRG